MTKRTLDHTTDQRTLGDTSHSSSVLVSGANEGSTGPGSVGVADFVGGSSAFASDGG